MSDFKWGSGSSEPIRSIFLLDSHMGQGLTLEKSKMRKFRRDMVQFAMARGLARLASPARPAAATTISGSQGSAHSIIPTDAR